MARYFNDPYSNQNYYGGVQGNAYTGSQTQQSRANANVEAAKKAPANDPVASFGNAAQSWANIFNPQQSAQDQYLQGLMGGQQPQRVMAAGTMQQDIPGGSPQQGVPMGPQPTPPPTTYLPGGGSQQGGGGADLIPPDLAELQRRMEMERAKGFRTEAGPAPVTNIQNGPGNEGPGRGRAVQPGGPAQQMPDPSAGPPNPGVPDDIWADAQRWAAEIAAKNPGDPTSAWILRNPQSIIEYRQDAIRRAAAGETGIAYWDWANSQYAPHMKPNDPYPGAGLVPGVDTWRGQDSTYGGVNPGISQSPSGVPGGYVGTDTPTGPPPAPMAPTAPQTPVAPTAPVAPPPGPPNDARIPANPSGGQPPSAPPSNQRSLAEELRELLNPEFRAQQEELSRALLAQQAYDKSINSGGSAVVRGKALGRLIGQQGSQLADYLAQGSEAEKNRELQRYGIDTQAQLTRAAQELDRYGIDINKYIQEYQINTNDKLQRFLGELDVQMRKYAADRGLDAANAGAAAQIAAANASAGASMYNADKDFQLGNKRADLDFQLGNRQITLQDIMNQRGYDLGIFGINRDIYQSDQRDRYQRDYLAWLMSPEARLGGGLPFNLPGQLVF